MKKLIQVISKLEGWIVFLALNGAILISGIPDYGMNWPVVLVTSLPFIILFGWLLCVGVALNAKLPEEEKEDLLLFHAANFYGMLIWPISQLATYLLESEWHIVLLPFLILLPISYFYAVYKSSMIFVDAQRPLNKGDQLSAGAIILAYFFYFIGAWLIQDRVRKILLRLNN